MRNLPVVVLAGLVLVLAVVLGLSLRENSRMQAALDDALVQIARLEKETAMLHTAPRVPAAPVGKPAQAPGPPDTVAEPKAEGPDLAAMMKLFMNQAAKGAKPGDATPDAAGGMQAKMMEAMGAMMEEGGFIEEAMNMGVDMQYGDFFEEAGLDPQTEQAVRQVLLDAARAAMEQFAEAARSGDIGAFEAQGDQFIEQLEAVRGQLAEILTPEQLTSFERYSDALPERMLGQSYEMQMSMMAPGLDDESRAVVRDALVETLMNGAATGAPAVLDDAAVEQVMGQLDGSLDAGQLEAARGFLERQARLAQFASPFVGE